MASIFNLFKRSKTTGEPAQQDITPREEFIPEKKEEQVDASEVINANRETLEGFRKSIVRARQKIAAITGDPDASKECLDNVQKLEDQILQSSPNAKKETEEVDNEIVKVIKTLEDSIKEGAFSAINTCIQCISDVIDMRSEPNEQNIRKIGMLVTKAKLSLEIILIKSIIGLHEATLEKANADQKEIDEKIDRRIANGESTRKVVEEYAEMIAGIKLNREEAQSGIDYQRTLLLQQEAALNEIEVHVKTKSVLDPNELQGLYSILKEVKTEELIRAKEKAEAAMQHADARRAHIKAMGEINANQSFVNQKEIQEMVARYSENQPSEQVEQKQETAEPVEQQTEKTEEKPVSTILS